MRFETFFEHRPARSPDVGDDDRTAHEGRERPRGRPRLEALRRLARDRGEQAFQGYVRRASDERLERTAGSDAALRLVFAAMAHAYEPDRAYGFAGELQYDLRRGDGRVVHWTVRVDPERATVRPGPAAAPALTLSTTVADFLRMAAGDLDAGRALLTGRLDVAGDFSLAQRLGEMFGRPAAL